MQKTLTMIYREDVMNWKEILKDEYSKEYYRNLYNFVIDEYKNHTIYPPFNLIENALAKTPYDAVKCVIIGQDPYHNPGQAMGLAFSVPKSEPIPPSLKNIYKELQNEFNYPIPNHGDLTEWTKQGVLLLNAILTVRKNQAASHHDKGWEIYTDAIIRSLNKKETPVVFLLWGRYAQGKKELITNPKHLILTTSHPSPFSANYGFLGCGHFKQCNDFLQKNNLTPINWQIT